MRRELHGKTINQRRESHGRDARLFAVELTRFVPAAQHSFEKANRLLVELLTDALHKGIAQCLAPCVDPEHPLDVVATLRHVALDEAPQLCGC